MYRHILIPTDGSELAEHGVAHGLALAKSLGAKVSVIFVVEPFSELTGRFLEAVATYAEVRKEQARSVLDRAAKAAKGAGVSCETIQVESGHPIKPSSQQPKTKAAISSSCHRMGAADFPCFSSAA